MYYKVFNKDSLSFIEELLKDGKKEIFDAIITDPPYNISRKNNFKTIGRFGIDFGTWDKNFNQLLWISKIAPLIKKGGSIIIFNDWKNLGDISKMLEKNDINVKDIIRWEKANPMPRNCKRRYVIDYEFAIWGVKKGAKWTFNNHSSKYLRPLYKTPLVRSNKIHPTQKPVELIQSIIKIHTNKNDLIFDPFMGSGSTGIACVQSGRNFIGCELDEKYFNFALQWISQKKESEANTSNKNIRSPLYYVGDKAKILNQLLPLFPNKINRFYDVFGGGGTVIANVDFKYGIYNDFNIYVKNLVNFLYINDFESIYNAFNTWRTKFGLVKQTKQNKAKACSNYKNARDFFNKNKKSLNDFEYNSLLFTLVVYSFNSLIRFNSKENFNVPIGKQDLNKERTLMLKEFINKFSKKKIEFISKDFNFVKEVEFNKNDFLYFDPPYSITLATYNSTWTKNDDLRLFKLLDELDLKGVKWALSNVFESKGIKNEALINWSKKYKINYINKSYKNSNYHRKNIGRDLEVLITNYEK